MKNDFGKLQSLVSSIALTFGVIGTALLPSTARAAPPEAEPESHSTMISVEHIHGRDVSHLLALSCRPASWSLFASWAKETGFITREFADTLQVQTFTDGFSLPEKHLKIRAVKSEIELSINDQVFSGTDPCQILADYHLHLQSEHKEEGATDEMSRESVAATLLSLAGGLQGYLPSQQNGGWGFVDAAFFLGTEGKSRGKAQMDFSRLSVPSLDAPEIRCTSENVTITTTIQKIVVRRSPSVKVDVFDRDSSQGNTGDKDSQYWKNAIAFLKPIIGDCKSKSDADQLLNSIDQTLENARATVAKVENPSGEAVRNPATTNNSKGD